MAIKTVGNQINRNTWLNFCEPTSLNHIKGSIMRPERIDYWELFIPPEIPASDNDSRHIVVAGDRLDLIAHKYYGASMLWWIIAERNDISLPLAELRQGMELTIPARSTVEKLLSKV